jgi:dihydroorotase
MIVCDLDREIAIAYVMNKLAPGIIGSDRSQAYVRAVAQCLTD